MDYGVRHKCAPDGGNNFLTLSWCYLPMSNYLRPHVAGACVFFTVGLANRRSDLLTREIAVLRTAVRRTKAERPFVIEAWVVLPDHMHCVWTLPEGDSDFSTRWSVIKARFSRALPHTPRQSRGPARAWAMAAAVLGASHPQRGGQARGDPVLLDQSGETWVIRQPRGLALFLHPPRRPHRLAVGCAFIAHRWDNGDHPCRLA